MQLTHSQGTGGRRNVAGDLPKLHQRRKGQGLEIFQVQFAHILTNWKRYSMLNRVTCSVLVILPHGAAYVYWASDMDNRILSCCQQNSQVDIPGADPGGSQGSRDPPSAQNIGSLGSPNF